MAKPGIGASGPLVCWQRSCCLSVSPGVGLPRIARCSVPCRTRERGNGRDATLAGVKVKPCAPLARIINRPWDVCLAHQTSASWELG